MKIRLYRLSVRISEESIPSFQRNVQEFASEFVPGQSLEISAVTMNSQYLEGSTLVVNVKIDGISPFYIRSLIEELVIDCFDDGDSELIIQIQESDFNGESDIYSRRGGGLSSAGAVAIACAALVAGIIAAAGFFIFRRRRRPLTS